MPGNPTAGLPWRRLAKGGIAAVVDKSLLHRLGQVGERGEISVIPVASRRSARRAVHDESHRSTARECHSRRIAAECTTRGSLRSLSAISARCRPLSVARSVTSAASCSRKCTAEVSTIACTASMRSAIEMIVAQPHQRVVAEKTAHVVAARAVEIYRLPPRRGVTIGEIRSEARQVVSRTDQSGCKRRRGAPPGRAHGRHRPNASVRPDRRRHVRRVKIDAVVAPSAASGEFGHRHQLDMAYAELNQVIELVDGRVKVPSGVKVPM